MFARVRAAIAELEATSRALDPDCLEGRDAAALVELAARGERVCAAIKARGARRVDETKVWRDGGHRSAAHWVAETTGETAGAACRTLEMARALDELPATREAFRSGQLSETQAAEITSAAGAEPAAEAELLATAAQQSVKGLRDRCRQVRAGAQADDQTWAREARYSICGVKACSNDQFLEIDHVVAVEDHGRTEDANLWRICPHHHKLKTHSGWRVTGTTHDWDLVPPDDPHPP